MKIHKKTHCQMVKRQDLAISNPILIRKNFFSIEIQSRRKNASPNCDAAGFGSLEYDFNKKKSLFNRNIKETCNEGLPNSKIWSELKVKLHSLRIAVIVQRSRTQLAYLHAFELFNGIYFHYT
jgi:hypothetical protein